MRRIVLGFMGTLSGLVLLFSYHTSTSSRLAVASGATTAPLNPEQCVRLPTTPSGQHGSPLSPLRIGAGGSPSSPSALRAQ